MKTPLRRFTLADGMILIAASALAIPLLQRVWGLYFAEDFFTRPPMGWTFKDISDKTSSLIGNLFAHGVAMATLAVLAMRLSPPRPTLRRLARQPGMIACCAVVLTLVINDLVYVGRISLVGVDNPFQKGFSHELAKVVMDGVGYSFNTNGYAVAAAWLTLALGARWRPEPSWSDRIGRAIGVFWIAMIPLYWWISVSGRMG
jgi:hypothetical protein